MDINAWKARIESRTDMTRRVTHLTKGATDDEAFEKLWKILIDKKLIAGTGFINGSEKVCCFQEVPLLSLAENLKYEASADRNKRYSAFGIRYNKGTLFSKGGRPVLYGDVTELKNILKPEEYWRIVSMSLTNSENIIDWTHEREWRIKGDFSFEYTDIEVIVQDYNYYNKFVNRCLNEDRRDILSKIFGIISIDSIIA